MPEGMYLRSACDWHLDPVGIDTLESFVKSQGLAATQVEPLSLEFYLRYADWFQRRKALNRFLYICAGSIIRREQNAFMP